MKFFNLFTAIRAVFKHAPFPRRLPLPKGKVGRPGTLPKVHVDLQPYTFLKFLGGCLRLLFFILAILWAYASASDSLDFMYYSTVGFMAIISLTFTSIMEKIGLYLLTKFSSPETILTKVMEAYKDKGIDPLEKLSTYIKNNPQVLKDESFVQRVKDYFKMNYPNTILPDNLLSQEFRSVNDLSYLDSTSEVDDNKGRRYILYAILFIGLGSLVYMNWDGISTYINDKNPFSSANLESDSPSAPGPSSHIALDKGKGKADDGFSIIETVSSYTKLAYGKAKSFFSSYLQPLDTNNEAVKGSSVSSSDSELSPIQIITSTTNPSIINLNSSNNPTITPNSPITPKPATLSLKDLEASPSSSSGSDSTTPFDKFFQKRLSKTPLLLPDKADVVFLEEHLRNLFDNKYDNIFSAKFRDLNADQIRTKIIELAVSYKELKHNDLAEQLYTLSKVEDLSNIASLDLTKEIITSAGKLKSLSLISSGLDLPGIESPRPLSGIDSHSPLTPVESPRSLSPQITLVDACPNSPKPTMLPKLSADPDDKDILNIVEQVSIPPLDKIDHLSVKVINKLIERVALLNDEQPNKLAHIERLNFFLNNEQTWNDMYWVNAFNNRAKLINDALENQALYNNPLIIPTIPKLKECASPSPRELETIIAEKPFPTLVWNTINEQAGYQLSEDKDLEYYQKCWTLWNERFTLTTLQNTKADFLLRSVNLLIFDLTEQLGDDIFKDVNIIRLSPDYLKTILYTKRDSLQFFGQHVTITMKYRIGKAQHLLFKVSHIKVNNIEDIVKLLTHQMEIIDKNLKYDKAYIIFYVHKLN